MGVGTGLGCARQTVTDGLLALLGPSKDAMVPSPIPGARARCRVRAATHGRVPCMYSVAFNLMCGDITRPWVRSSNMHYCKMYIKFY